jgi:hypothetical protein
MRLRRSEFSSKTGIEFEKVRSIMIRELKLKMESEQSESSMEV